jgi:hypothetical protein
VGDTLGAAVHVDIPANTAPGRYRATAVCRESGEHGGGIRFAYQDAEFDITPAVATPSSPAPAKPAKPSTRPAAVRTAPRYTG